MASDRTDGGLSRIFGVNNDPKVKSLTFVSGTAQQPHVSRDSIVYLQITGGTSGAYQIDIGPTASVANSIIAAAGGAPAGVDIPVTIKLPGGWYIKVTITSAAAIAQAICISD